MVWELACTKYIPSLRRLHGFVKKVRTAPDEIAAGRGRKKDVDKE